MIRKLFLTIFLILAFAVPGWGATKTVCSAGCDETTIQAVFDNNDLAPADVVEARADSPGGTVYYRETVTWGANDAGDSGNDVTLQGRSGDTVIVSAGDLVATWAQHTTTDYTADGNIVAYYMFEAAPGLDQSGTGDNHVDDDGASDPDVDSTNYKEGARSADFVIGNSDNLQCTNANLTADFPGDAASDSFTVVAWIRPDTDTTSTGIAGMYDGGATSWRFILNATSKAYATLVYSDGGGGSTNAAGTTALQADTWYHVALVLDGTANLIYIYVDGTVENGGGSGTAFDHTLDATASDFWVGDNTGTYYFDGNIDEMGILDRALSSAEINEIKDSGFAGSAVTNVWKATLAGATETFVVAMDQTVGNRETSVGAVDADTDWYHDTGNNLLYQYSTSDPDTRYTTPGTEAGRRSGNLSLGQNYVTIDNLDIRLANAEFSNGILIDATNITIQNSTIRDNSHRGIQVHDDANTTLIDNCTIYGNSTLYSSGQINIHGSSTDTTIQDSDIYNSVVGHGVAGGGTNVTISQNSIYANPNYTPDGAPYLYHNIYCSGNGSNWIVEKNKIWNAFDGNGIGWMADSGHIRWNLIYASENTGIILSQQTNGGSTYIYANIIHGNNKGIDLNDNSFHAGANVYIYNNTIAENDDTSKGTPRQVEVDIDVNALEFKNNIVMSSTTDAGYYLMYFVAQSSLSSDYNQYYGGDSSNPFYYDANKTFTTWKTAISDDANSAEADPLFTDYASDDFTLQSGSPAIDQGADLGDTYDDALATGSSWPSSVSTVDQDGEGSTWEIGAYIFDSTTKLKFHQAPGFSGGIF